MFSLRRVASSHHVARTNRSTCRRFGARPSLECIVAFTHEYSIGVRLRMYDWNFSLNVPPSSANDGVGVSAPLKLDALS